MCTPHFGDVSKSLGNIVLFGATLVYGLLWFVRMQKKIKVKGGKGRDGIERNEKAKDKRISPPDSFFLLV